MPVFGVMVVSAAEVRLSIFPARKEKARHQSATAASSLNLFQYIFHASEAETRGLGALMSANLPRPKESGAVILV